MLAYTEEDVKLFNIELFAYLLVTVEDHVLSITLNRPEKKNAMNPQMFAEITFALNYAHYEKSIWMVVIQANGNVFCAGADLKSFAGIEENEKKSGVPQPKEVIALGNQFNHLYKPCIAKVHAPVYAGGFLLICGCTHVLANENATFSLPEVKRGIWPMQVMASLAPIIPARQLLDWCMRAKTLNVEEAYRLGLVTQIEAAPNLDKATLDLVQEIKTFSPAAIRLGLKAWHDFQSVSEDQAHQFLLQRLGEILGTDDAVEGLAAFREKRSPVWKG